MRTLALGSYKEAPFVTGGMVSRYGLQTEILDYDNAVWNQVDDYPSSNGDK